MHFRVLSPVQKSSAMTGGVWGIFFFFQTSVKTRDIGIWKLKSGHLWRIKSPVCQAFGLNVFIQNVVDMLGYHAYIVIGARGPHIGRKLTLNFAKIMNALFAHFAV
jgi:hypothetical protein